MSEYQLTQEIIRRSTAPTWAKAKVEWQLAEVYYQAEPATCLCGHYPINEICVIRNKLNGRSVEVGNVCVKKFLGLPSDKIFKALHRIMKDDSTALTKEAVEHAHSKGWISDWERTFSLDTMRKRSLSPKQLDKRKQINRLVLELTRRARGAAL